MTEVTNREDVINASIKQSGVDTNKISDGYHTFGELYEHRIALFIAFCNVLGHGAWKAKRHSDGSSYENWFIAGIGFVEGEQISYHIPMDKWDMLKVHEVRHAPPFDGHTSNDVIERLYKL